MSSSRGLRKLQRRNVVKSDLRLHKRFNIFTRDGRNINVTPPYPMTLGTAQAYYNALCIGADD